MSRAAAESVFPLAGMCFFNKPTFQLLHAHTRMYTHAHTCNASYYFRCEGHAGDPAFHLPVWVGETPGGPLGCHLLSPAPTLPAPEPRVSAELGARRARRSGSCAEVPEAAPGPGSWQTFRAPEGLHTRQPMTRPRSPAEAAAGSLNREASFCFYGTIAS